MHPLWPESNYLSGISDSDLRDVLPLTIDIETNARGGGPGSEDKACIERGPWLIVAVQSELRRSVLAGHLPRIIGTDDALDSSPAKAPFTVIENGKLAGRDVALLLIE